MLNGDPADAGRLVALANATWLFRGSAPVLALSEGDAREVIDQSQPMDLAVYLPAYDPFDL